MAGRVNTGTTKSESVTGDNGYLVLILTLGWAGSAILFFTLFSMWRQIIKIERLGFKSDITRAAKTVFIIGAISLYGWNWLNGASSMAFWLLMGRALVPAITPAQLARLRLLAQKKAEMEATPAVSAGALARKSAPLQSEAAT